MRRCIFLKYVFIFLCLSLLFCCKQAQPIKTSGLFSKYTSAEERQKSYFHLIESTIEGNLQLNLSDSTESNWQSAFWGMGLTQYRSTMTDQAVRDGIREFFQRSANFQRGLLEVIFQLYPNEFKTEIEQIIQRTRNAKLFAMGIHYLLRLNRENKASELKEIMEGKFPDWSENPILFLLNRDLEQTLDQKRGICPPLVDFFSFEYGKNVMVIFSLHRKNRDYPGLTIIRDRNERFLRNADGNIFHMSHFSRSASNLPSYLTNGNSPQGIYSIRGLGQSDNVFIGPTPTLELQLPVEASVQDFFLNQNFSDTVWNREKLNTLLPNSWKKYFPIYETFYAGKAGRTEIIAHGTTINPEYYRASIYYPNTPSLGCLTALELWNPSSGACFYSDQVTLINAFNACQANKGYFILIEMDDQEKAVPLTEIVDQVIQAELQMTL